VVPPCRFQHQVLYDILVYRRPEKLLSLGQGIIYINIPLVA
jgi:hypothetical protein